MKEPNINYSKINPYERARLFVKALERGDLPYAKRLANSSDTGQTQFARHLKGARECTLLVSLELQMILGGWEAFNAFLLPIANSDHVYHFYEEFRYFPERVEKVYMIVGTIEDLLIEKTMRPDGSDNSDLLERADEYVQMMIRFLFNEDSEMEGGYTSSVSTFPDVILDRRNCMLTCYILGKAREGVVASIGPKWLAFRSVCQSELELDAEIVLKAFQLQNVISLVEDFRFELDNLDPQLDIDRETEAALRDFWQSNTS